MKALTHWKMRKRELREMNESFRNNLSSENQGTVGKLDPFLLTEMLKVSGHADTEYVADLLCGFPIVGDLPSGENGTPIPGGQRVHGKPGLGGSLPLHELKEKCAQINEATVRRARQKVPRTSRAVELAWKTWEKVKKDIDDNRAGVPVELESISLEDCLLVDTFGVWERHAGSDWKVRVINNFKSNAANDYAWMPSKLRYNGFSDLKEAAEKLKENWGGALEMGKSDFRSGRLQNSPTEPRAAMAMLGVGVQSRAGKSIWKFGSGGRVVSYRSDDPEHHARPL